MKLVVGLGNPKKYDGTSTTSGCDYDHAKSLLPARRSDLTPSLRMAGGHREDPADEAAHVHEFERPSRAAGDGFLSDEHKDLLVICDDMALPRQTSLPGTRHARWHNGLRDIQQHLGTTEYSWLRIGVDVPEQERARSITCSASSNRARSRRSRTHLSLAVQSVAMWVKDGTEKCMNQYNA